jgi:hypothetical protein
MFPSNILPQIEWHFALKKSPEKQKSRARLDESKR